MTLLSLFLSIDEWGSVRHGFAIRLKCCGLVSSLFAVDVVVVL